uniref:BEACH domain-containing protein n=1 Tax=Parascaris equorum TaxID=6256 RepID=A0A914S664_PAREQ
MFAFADEDTVRKVVECLPRVGVGYPIFPWVLANYTSPTLDLNIASNFRDLSKPVGALSEARRKFFQERYSSWEHESIPPFHYGTHYSTQAFTLNWLLRELIPELFYMPEMLLNGNDLDLGSRDDGAVLGDVVLPPWARSPEHFIALHRQALENSSISFILKIYLGFTNLSVDVRATNVFYYLTYEGALNLNSIENATVREGLEQQMISFGQTPAQLMAEPHPPRHSVMTISPTMFQSYQDDLCMLMKFISNSAIVHLSANTFAHGGSESLSSAPNNLPLTVDPLLAAGNPSQPLARRHLGDALDQRLKIRWNNFVTTVESRSVIVCGYPDYSFRVIDTDSVLFNSVAAILWHWNAQTQTIAGEYNVPGDYCNSQSINQLISSLRIPVAGYIISFGSDFKSFSERVEGLFCLYH